MPPAESTVKESSDFILLVAIWILSLFKYKSSTPSTRQDFDNVFSALDLTTLETPSYSINVPVSSCN